MSKQIGSQLIHSAQSDANQAFHQSKLNELHEKIEKVHQGGGLKALQKHKSKNKLTARERIEYLIDDSSIFHEIATFAAHDMYQEQGGCPSAGVITGIGIIHGRECMIVANDATVKAGAWFPMTAKKNMRAQEIAIENHLPIVYLVDSAGVFLPMQDQIFPDKEHFGRQFRNNAILSAKGIPQIAAIMGPCVAGGAYLPIMCDEAIIVEGSGSLFLAGPALVEAAIGEKIEIEALGGASMHSAISGNTDYRVKTDEEALDLIRELMSSISPLKGKKQIFDRIESKPPKYDSEEIYSILPADRTKPYSTHEFLARILDDSSFEEYKQDYGKTIICGYGRIDGWSVGIVINNRAISKSGKGEMQVGGVIYSDSADKAARFIMNCNQRLIPIIFFQDVTGFMVGSRAEQGGIIKDGAKLVNAVSNSIVPKITFIIGNSYGAGNYAMCGKAYDPRFIFAYPTAQIAVMGGAQASKTLLTIKVASLEKEGKQLTEEEKHTMLKEIQSRYDAQTTPYYAASHLWVDEIILPHETREKVSMALTCASHNAEIPVWKSGVLQV